MSFYAKRVDFENRESMIAFLTGHLRYFTAERNMKTFSYANNVKVYNLGISDRLILEKAMILARCGGECKGLTERIKSVCDDFFFETGFFMDFNGESDGYIVMYATGLEHGETMVYPYYSVDFCENFEDLKRWPLKRLRDRCAQVCSFDAHCDTIRDLFIEWCKDSCCDKVSASHHV